MIDLKNRIKTELEKGFGWDIDNKTIKTISVLLKEDGLINTFEFDIRYFNEIEADSDEESEEVEDYDGEGDDPEFKLKKVKKREKKRETKEESVRAKHSKIILTKPGVSKSDPRIHNDPSITNPSLRQDKELPNSILKKMIEFKQKQEIKNKEENEKESEANNNSISKRTRRSKARSIEDLILQKKPSLEQKLLIQSKCQNSVVQSSAVKMMNFISKIDQFMLKYTKNINSFTAQKLKNFLPTNCINHNKIMEEICQWYGYTFIDKRGARTEICHNNTQSEGYYLSKISHMMDTYSSLSHLENIETFSDISPPSQPPPKEFKAFPNIQQFYSLPLHDDLHHYLKLFHKKKPKKQIMLTTGEILSFSQNLLKKLLKHIQVSVQELRQEFNCNSTLVQVLWLLDFMDIVEVEKGIVWYVWLKEMRRPEFE